jgi:hypothetical protein
MQVSKYFLSIRVTRGRQCLHIFFVGPIIDEDIGTDFARGFASGIRDLNIALKIENSAKQVVVVVHPVSEIHTTKLLPCEQETIQSQIEEVSQKMRTSVNAA